MSAQQGAMSLGIRKELRRPSALLTRSRTHSVPPTKVLPDSRGSGESGSRGGVGKSGSRSRGSRGVVGVAEQEAKTLAGPVEESDVAHRRRHPKPLAGCIRCVYEKNRQALESTYGSYSLSGDIGSYQRRAVWLAARPVRYGGSWGVGCICCARLLESNTDKMEDLRRAGIRRDKAPKRGPAHANTKWARFEFRNPTQLAARGLRQHEQTLQHRKAVRWVNAPPDLREKVIMAPEDSELFRGGVPQPADFVQAWNGCLTSFHQCEKNGLVLSWLSGRRSKGASRKAFAAMVRVMALVVRLTKKARLRACTAISIGIDDRGAYRLITYRCDTPCPSAEVTMRVGELGSSTSQSSRVGESGSSISQWTGWTSGCLGVLRRGGNASSKTLEDADDDYSQTMAQSIVRAFRNIATGVDGVCDEHISTWMMNRVRIGIADGAASAQKCLKFLACGPMPNMWIVGRDHAHAVRIATRDPLLSVEQFEAWWQDVFDSQFALVPAIQNSEEWSEKLLLCQKLVLGSRGAQGAGLKVVARCLSFAKQRFDSVATPMRQFCCLLTAIAMLLAHVASDSRTKPSVRDRARRRLRELPDHIPTAGLCASYADLAIRFVRLFDQANHDPARTWEQFRTFRENMRILFIEGHIWSSTVGESGVGESRCSANQTLLETVLREAKDAPTIYYGDGQVLRLFQQPSLEQQRQLQKSVHHATQVMFDRVDVELSLDNAIVLFTAMDLGRWRRALLSGRNGVEDPLLALRRHCRRFLAVWRHTSDATMAQFEGVAAKLVQDNRVDIDAGKISDYREVWVQALRPNFGVNVCRVEEVIRIYLAALDGTCGVERDLGVLTRVLQAHSGPTDQDGHTVSHCLELTLDGPTKCEEIAALPTEVGVSGSTEQDHRLLVLPTEFSRECVRLWRQCHGSRFRIYSGKENVKKGPKTGTMGAVKRGVAIATDIILKRAREANGIDKTVLGVPRGQLIFKGALPAAAPKSKLKKFQSLTATKQKILDILGRARSVTALTHRNPYTVPDLNPNLKLRRSLVLTAKPSAQMQSGSRGVIVPRNGSIHVASCCKQVVPPTDGYTITVPAQASSPAAALEELVSAQLIIWDWTWQLDGVVEVPHLISAIIAIGFGRSILCRARWQGPLPHTNTSVVHYLPAAKHVPATLVMVGELGSKHGNVCAALRRVANTQGSKWTIVSETAAAASKATKLSTLRDVRNFLRQSRRVRTGRSGLVTDLIRRR